MHQQLPGGTYEQSRLHQGPDHQDIRTSGSPFLPLELDTLFYFLIDLVCIYGVHLGSCDREKKWIWKSIQTNGSFEWQVQLQSPARQTGGSLYKNTDICVYCRCKVSYHWSTSSIKNHFSWCRKLHSPSPKADCTGWFTVETLGQLYKQQSFKS